MRRLGCLVAVFCAVGALIAAPAPAKAWWVGWGAPYAPYPAYRPYWHAPYWHPWGYRFGYYPYPVPRPVVVVPPPVYYAPPPPPPYYPPPRPVIRHHVTYHPRPVCTCAAPAAAPAATPSTASPPAAAPPAAITGPLGGPLTGPLR